MSFVKDFFVPVSLNNLAAQHVEHFLKLFWYTKNYSSPQLIESDSFFHKGRKAEREKQDCQQPQQSQGCVTGCGFLWVFIQ